MMYFGLLPVVARLEDSGDYRLVKDILTSIIRAKTPRGSRGDVEFFQTYTIRESDTPQGVADKFYGNVKYWWVPFVINSRTPRDWPLTNRELERYIDLTYGSRRFDTHHYESGGDEVARVVVRSFVDAGTSETIDFYSDGSGFGAGIGNLIVGDGEPVSNEDYERARNEALRTIQMLRPEHLKDFVSEFSRAAGRSTSVVF